MKVQKMKKEKINDGLTKHENVEQRKGQMIKKEAGRSTSQSFPEEGELVLCTVTRVLHTGVFVNLDKYNKDGLITLTEVSPGRIRNIRDYVKVNKKIVCKVLKVDESSQHIFLSLRRVSNSERAKIIEDYKKEKDYTKMLHFIIKQEDKLKSVVSVIKQDYETLVHFFNYVMQKTDAERMILLKRYFNSGDIGKLIEVLTERFKVKPVEIKQEFTLKTRDNNGVKKLNAIGSIIEKLNIQNVKITSLGSPKYLIKIVAGDYKKANTTMKSLIKKIESTAKELNIEINFDKNV